MPVIAYLTNQFPSPVEPYVVQEIQELRKRGVEVIPCSARRAQEDNLAPGLKALMSETVYLQPLRLELLIRAAWLCLRRFALLSDLIERVLVQGGESPLRRLRALLHTWLGAYYALRLRERSVEHIHVHHGYFASWVAMVAARLLGIGFSMTLHGSDLLRHRAYLDTKLKNCGFCFTISEFNRRYLLQHYPEAAPEKISVHRLGVDPLRPAIAMYQPEHGRGCFIMLAVGRLHPVKDHAFLVRACRLLKDRGLRCLTLIAGEGSERPTLEKLIRDLNLADDVKLLGHVCRQQLDSYYTLCDLVVLTSRSEGIPLALMEAMSHGKTVLAPAITGIPELIVDGKTGFLYCAGSMEDFAARIEAISKSHPTLGPLRQRARQHVLEHFDREKNLAAFADSFLSRVVERAEQIA